ncbi:CHAP domain-containing protein [Streptomyces sp. NBC_00454]|uniref:CHAP domain-containing protein n=1 Tax=Streptomyces sp. NBC_00454 TaxID=2975747 RepID=UPI0030DDE66C
MKPSLPKNLLTVVLGMLALLATVLTTAPAAQAATTGDIARVAEQEASRPHGCSYYGDCPGGGWCAVFATWVWRQAGVGDLGGLGISAKDFYQYGVRHNTVDQIPNIGDAVVFNLNGDGTYADHVNIVVAVAGDTVTTVGGNESGTVQRTSWNWRQGTNAGGQHASAYVAPVGLGSAVHEVSGLSSGWQDGTVTGASTSAISAVMVNGYRTVYSIQNGQLHERSAATGWGDGYIPTGGSVTAVSAMVHNGARLVYVIRDGGLYELDGGNGWAMGRIPTTAPVTAVSAISVNGIRLVYVVENGVVHEVNAGAGWSDSALPSTSQVTAVSAVNRSGIRMLYTVQNGRVHEVDGGAGWSNTQVSATAVSTVSAVIHNGVRLIYAVDSQGRLREFDGGNGWAEGTVMPQAVGPGSLSAISDNGIRRVYTLQ